MFGELRLPSPLTGKHAVRVLREAGFKADVLERPLAQIHPMMFPVILLMRDGGACILTGRGAGAPADATDEGEPGAIADAAPTQARYEVVIPEAEPFTTVLAEPDLLEQYSGLLIAARPQLMLGGEPVALSSPSDPTRHWLWGTLRRFVPYYRSTMLAALLSNVLMLVVGLFSSVMFRPSDSAQGLGDAVVAGPGTGVAIAFDLLARQLRSHLIDLAGKKAT